MKNKIKSGFKTKEEIIEEYKQDKKEERAVWIILLVIFLFGVFMGYLIWGLK